MRTSHLPPKTSPDALIFSGILDFLQRHWFDGSRQSAFFLRHCLLWLLFFPFHALFMLVARARYFFYHFLSRPVDLPVPVIVVGNILVGGTGKTPLTLWLAENLQAAGFHPGIVSRGYGSKEKCARAVGVESTVNEVGDEPLLLFRRSGVPVYVAKARIDAAKTLLSEHPLVDVLLCDDGLQHHLLPRQMEIAVFDKRGVGNGWRLPLGPLREPLSRLNTVDAVVLNGGIAPQGLPAVPVFSMALEANGFYRLDDPSIRATAAYFHRLEKPCYALAGIGYPARFFSTLQDLKISANCRAFPDHHPFVAADLSFAAGGFLLMTEKDAVKCAALLPFIPESDRPDGWVLQVDAVLPADFIDVVVEKIRGSKTR